MDDVGLRALAIVIAKVDGVVGVVGVLLGGSRAPDAHTTNSDYDLGIYLVDRWTSTGFGRSREKSPAMQR